MTDDPLDLLVRPAPLLDDDRFTRAVLRRAHVPVAPPRRRRAAAAGMAAACALILALVSAIATAPTAFGLAAVAAVTWAIGRLGER